MNTCICTSIYFTYIMCFVRHYTRQELLSFSIFVHYSYTIYNCIYIYVCIYICIRKNACAFLYHASLSLYLFLFLSVSLFLFPMKCHMLLWPCSLLPLWMVICKKRWRRFSTHVNNIRNVKIDVRYSYIGTILDYYLF